MPRKAFKTSPPAAKLAETIANSLAMVVVEATAVAVIVESDKCSQRFVRPVAHKPKFPLSLIPLSPFTAAIALKNHVINLGVPGSLTKMNLVLILSPIGWDAGDIFAQNQSVNIFGAFVGIYTF